MLGSCQELLAGVAVAVTEGYVLLTFGTAFPDLLVLKISCHPAVGDTQVIDCLIEQPLHMETVIGQIGMGKDFSRYLHHRRGKIQRHLPDGLALIKCDLLKYRYDILRLGTPDHGYQRSFASVPLRVSHNRVEFPATETGLIDTYDRTDVFLIQNPVMRVIKLVPVPVTTEHFLVLA